jgi:hypothetical protein
MSENVVGLSARRKKPRVTYKGFAKAFHRLEVQRPLEPVKAEDLKHFPIFGSPPMEWYTARYVGPGEQFYEAGLHALKDLGLAPELLVFRVLRDLLGPPDNATVAFPEGVVTGGRELREGESPFLLEWSFLLVGASEVVYEIRKQPGTQQPHLAIWLPRVASVSVEKQKLLASEFKLFVRELRRTLDESQALIDKHELRRKSVAVGPLNVYRDLLAAGDEQLSIVAERPKRHSSTTAKSSGGNGGIPTAPGTFCMAAAIQYLLALEAFVNVVSELLRKESFSDQVFSRLTSDMDFESRLLSLSLFCGGFRQAPFTPGLPLFKRIRELRSFRNKVMHGAFSHDDHVLRLLTEDHYMFYWWPAADEPTLAGSSAAGISLPLAPALFTKRHADHVRRNVEEAVDAIIEAMEPAYRSWANAWRHEQAIPAVQDAHGWRPSLARAEAAG